MLILERCGSTLTQRRSTAYTSPSPTEYSQIAARLLQWSWAAGGQHLPTREDCALGKREGNQQDLCPSASQTGLPSICVGWGVLMPCLHSHRSHGQWHVATAKEDLDPQKDEGTWCAWLPLQAQSHSLPVTLLCCQPSEEGRSPVRFQAQSSLKDVFRSLAEAPYA